LFDRVFSDGLPASEVSIPLHHTPEEEPVKMADVVHQKQGPWLERVTMAKCANTDTKKMF
jgi:hypothetical protein